jgi:hypothetical protein
MRVVLGLFGDPAQAVQAIQALKARKYDLAETYALVRLADPGSNQTGAANSRGLPANGKAARELRQVLGRSHNRRLPDIGPVLAFNDLAVSLADAALPNVDTGGLRVALQELGLEAHAAEACHQGLEHGMLVLFLRTPDDRALAASQVLEANGGRSVFIYSTIPA